MVQWRGFDTGGVEQIWDDTLIVEVLAVFHLFQPFDRGNGSAEFYDRLEELFPEITWREYDVHKSFRPIFRRANPWVKLGLITPESIGATVTQVGEEVLSATKSLQEVYIEAVKIFVEGDGITRSFAEMCKCAIALPNEIFSLEDVEFAFSNNADSTIASYLQQLDKRRVDKQLFPQGSRRTRVLRRFMSSLVSAGALMEVTGGWKLASVIIATEIVGQNQQVEQFQGISTFTGSRTVFITNVKTISPGARPIRTISAAGSSKLDPAQRALLLERAHSEHERIVEICADFIRSKGGNPIEDLNSFDVGCHAHPSVIFEVKSITQTNCISQLRKAIAQLPEYRWRHRMNFENDTYLVIALNTDPRAFVDDDFLTYITNDRNILITWPVQNLLFEISGRSLEDVLNL